MGHGQQWLWWVLNGSKIIKVVHVVGCLFLLFPCRWHPWALVFATCRLASTRSFHTSFGAVSASTLVPSSPSTSWDLQLHNRLVNFPVPRQGRLHVSRLSFLCGLSVVLVLNFVYLLDLIRIDKLESLFDLRFGSLVPLGVRKGFVESPVGHFLGWARKSLRLHRGGTRTHI